MLDTARLSRLFRSPRVLLAAAGAAGGLLLGAPLASGSHLAANPPRAAARAADAVAGTGGSPSTGAATASVEGPSERFELDGTWLFRFDNGVGQTDGFATSSSTAGWSPVSVPNAWNATEQGKASMAGTVAWYRKDFELPASSGDRSWAVRFESVNNRVQAWLNGKPIGSHTVAYLPFELVLPAKLLKRQGLNHLVLRVDSRRRATDFPSVGYFWNYGGILRKVHLQAVNEVGFSSVRVLPRLACAECSAVIEYRVALHNYTTAPQTVHLTSTYGTLPVDLGTATIAAGASRTFSRQATLSSPQLWSPSSPTLYDVTLLTEVISEGGEGGESPQSTPVGHYFLRSGVRSIEVSPEGALLLNGQALDFRGVGVIEDSKRVGAALSEAAELHLITEARELGATAIRSQYPLDQHIEELADEDGIMLWSEIPVDKVPNRYLAMPSVRARAVALLRENILANSSHPSIIVWSIADELDPRPEQAQGTYISQAVAAAHALDPTRPVGLAVAAYPSVGCQPRYYGPLQVIGLNDYFGWYPGPVGDLKSRNALSPYLDKVHGCYAGKSIVVTEFGAEANRTGPANEPGSYAFQQEFAQFHLSVFATKPWLSGAIYWALQEFRVRPGWTGGNPKPSPPLHTKGLISFTGFRKPAFYAVQQIYKATTQLSAK